MAQLLQSTFWRFLKKLKTELPHDPAILVLGIYLGEKSVMQKDTCNPVFTAAQFTTAKPWEQPECALAENRLKKMWCVHMMEYYSAVKRMRRRHLLQHVWT